MRSRKSQDQEAPRRTTEPRSQGTGQGVGLVLLRWVSPGPSPHVPVCPAAHSSFLCDFPGGSWATCPRHPGCSQEPGPRHHASLPLAWPRSFLLNLPQWPGGLGHQAGHAGEPLQPGAHSTELGSCARELPQAPSQLLSCPTRGEAGGVFWQEGNKPRAPRAFSRAGNQGRQRL